MTQRVTGQRFRQRKLSTKANLPVIHEDELEHSADDDAARHIPKVETGVEKGEEVEHHLQAVISAAQAAAQGGGKVAQLFIPTPDAVASKLQYEDLYPRRFTQPATYIRFSSTVEDTIGCPYCMNSDDIIWLKQYNARLEKLSKHIQVQCSEDSFEEVMSFFEETAHTKQPYASVGNAPVLSYEELEAEFDETISESSRQFAKEIYSHWKNRRLFNGNRPLIASVKYETNIETDDADPYVCFRRREVRQVRKTRGRDAQVTEKLKKLRKELEEGRFLMSQVRRRELLLRDQLAMEKQIFEQRCAVKEIKRRLGIKDNDEEILINHKPAPKPKARVDTHPAVRVGIPGMASKPQITRSDGRVIDSDLVYLEDQQAKRSEAIDAFIEENLQKHQRWNQGWVDETWRPITPPLELPASKSGFRPVFTSSNLPTPPASVSEDGYAMEVDQSKELELRRSARIRYGSPPNDVPYVDQTRFRRRIGRGGRTMIDRRGVKPQKLDSVDKRVDDRIADRYKFSGDSSEEDQTYPVDWTDNLNIRYRIMIDRQQGGGDKSQQQQQQQQAQQAAAAAAAQNRRAIQSASGHLMPPSAG